jgi:putative addiction module killer protein
VDQSKFEPTEIFQRWLARLKDRQARTRIIDRVERLCEGNFGDIRSLGGGLFELRLDFGHAYRIYFTQRGRQIVLLLCGGDKSSQNADIRKAEILAEQETEGGTSWR